MIKALLKPFGTESFLIGLGIAAAAYMMGPQLKKSLKPAVVKGAQGMLILGSQAGELINQGKSKLNEMIQETPPVPLVKAEEFNNLANEIRQDREQYNAILKELKDSIVSLKDQIADLKRS